MIAIVAAIGKNKELGKNNQLLWHLPNDLKYFKQLTLNKTILMGRKTFESIGKPLPERRNIVLTRQNHFKAEGIETAASLKQALAMAGDKGETMIIGGAEIYQQALSFSERMYITEVDYEGPADAYFPEWYLPDWVETFRVWQKADDKNPYNHSFVVYERKK